ncbi:MAG: tRNA lysidine(34) synthetase TilS [Candidatus Promineifilaceae bacterium]
MDLLGQVTAVLRHPPVHLANILSDARLTWIIGVSGGVDSLALLHIFRQLVPPQRVLAAHVNHQLRPQAQEDAQFVKNTAESWQISFVQQVVDAAALAAKERLSVEAAGRLARYRFFAQLARQYWPAVVVVGHHADDQAETVLLHLIRGSGLAGLRGMQMFGVLPVDRDVPLLRPFLHSRRSNIEQYCQQNNLSPRVDESNADTAYLRNRVRHELLPLLATYNPQIVQGLGQLADITTADYAFLQEQASLVFNALILAKGEGWLRLDRARWQQRPLSLQRLILKTAINYLNPAVTDVGLPAVTEALNLLHQAQGSQTALLPGGISFRAVYNQVVMALPGTQPHDSGPQLLTSKAYTLPVPGTVTLADGWQITAEWAEPMTVEMAKAHASPWTVYAAWEEGDHWVVRPRKTGERVQPLGMNGRSTPIKKVMINAKTPQPLREKWPIVANAQHPIWIAGHMLDHRARVTADTHKTVRLRCWQKA